MAVVDERGRIAGRVNVIDAFVAIVCVILIPMAYGAYLLFRAPQPKLTNIAPSTLYEGPNLRIGIGGQNLRPFMRVTFNTTQGRTFMIGSTTNAAVDLPDLPPGTYDVVLFDHMQEIDRLPKALTILPLAPMPTVELEVAGSFLFVGENGKGLAKGVKFPPTGNNSLAELMELSAAIPADLHIRSGDVTLGVPVPGTVQLPAILRVKCYVTAGSEGTLRCMFPGPQAPVAVAPDANLSLQGPGGWVNFQVSEVHTVTSPAVARARVTFTVTPFILSKMKPGDNDTSVRANAKAHSARIVSLDGAGADRRSMSATLEVPVEQTPAGWTYKQDPFKIGTTFSFETPQYIVAGEVVDITLPSAAPAQGGGR
jgi:hypothetical protein